jgi:hypothetical protein
VRLAAYSWVSRARPAAAVPALILNLGKESGRPRAEALRALKTITLRDFGFDAAAWKNWWEPVAKDFVPPAADKPKKNDARPVDAAAAPETKVDAPLYHDFIVRSDRVAFLVDVSGSMRSELASGATSTNGNKSTKLAIAADALHDVVARLPKGTRVTIVVFNNQPLRYRDASKSNASAWLEASPKLAADVKKFVLAIGASNYTNISDSLELVLDDPDVDTIYLLTDGAPSEGKRNLGSRIVEWVRRVNAFTRTEVNTIALGASDRDFGFLRNLAEATGGTCVRK